MGGNAEEELAVAQVLIGEADFFRAEEERNFGAGLKMLMNDASGGFEAMQGLLWGAAGAGGGANDERTVGDGIGHLIEFFSCLEDGLCVDGGAGIAKSDIVGMDDAEVLESEVGHGASRCSDVERVAGGNEDDTEAICFRRGEHDRPF